MEQPATDSEVIDATSEQSEADESLLGSDFDEEVETPAEEEEEVDIDGLKLSLPKSKAEKLKAERLMQADYTRKTQEVAEQRRQVEYQAQEYQQRAQMQQAFLSEIANVTAIDKHLAEYDKVDWGRLTEEDPVQAMKLDFQRRELLNEKNQLIANITQKQQSQAMEQQHLIAKRVHEASEYLKREIKDWSDQKSDELLKYGVSYGIPAETLSQTTIHHPQFAQILNKAALYDQLIKKQTPAAQVVEAKPVSKVSGTSSSVKKDPSKMTDEEFNSWRRSQIKRK